MRGIVNNLSKYRHSHSQGVTYDDGPQSRIRSLSRNSRYDFARRAGSSAKKLPRTYQPVIRPRNSLLANSEMLFYYPKGLLQYKRLPAFAGLESKKELSSTQATKGLSRTVTAAFTQSSTMKSGVPPPYRRKQYAGHTAELWKLRVNDLFFCLDCYRYIFRIYFDYHYPTCKDAVPNDLPPVQRKDVGLCRLRLIKYLLSMMEVSGKAQLYQLIKDMKEGRGPTSPLRDTRSGYFYLIQDIGGVLNLIWSELLN